MTKASLLTVAAALLAACGSSASAPCPGHAGACVNLAAGMTEAQVQAALATLPDDSVVTFGAGSFTFQNSLAFNANKLTVQGAGATATTLDFGPQAGGAGGEGISSIGDDFYIHDLAIKDSAGNGVKMSGATNQHVNRVRVTWSNGGVKTNGPYGIYPVACTNVLVENSYAAGASDTGFYVGQSTNVVVRHNEAESNVMGVEIENCHGAEVHDNDLHGNTGGVLVFTGPNLAQKDGNTTRVHHNTIASNNHPNFGYGGMVTNVPAGSGVVVMANRDVEIDHNTITGNDTVAVGLISFLFTGLQFMTAPDPAYDPYMKRAYVHDNTFGGNGTSPDFTIGLGQLLGSLLGSPVAPDALPDVMFDGVIDPAIAAAPPAGFASNPMQVCLGTGTPPSFVDLTQNLDCPPSEPGPCLPASPSIDATPYACDLPSLAPIALSL